MDCLNPWKRRGRRSFHDILSADLFESNSSSRLWVWRFPPHLQLRPLQQDVMRARSAVFRTYPSRWADNPL